MAETEELSVPGTQSLAEDERRDLDDLREVVVGDHVKQEILVQAGDSEAIARRLGQRTQASVTYPAEEEDAKNIADADIFEIEEDLREQREEAEQAKVAELESELAESQKSSTQQVMEAHEEATAGSEEKLPSTHADLDALAAEEGVDLTDATTVAEKQAAIEEARAS